MVNSAQHTVFRFVKFVLRISCFDHIIYYFMSSSLVINSPSYCRVQTNLRFLQNLINGKNDFFFSNTCGINFRVTLNSMYWSFLRPYCITQTMWDSVHWSGRWVLVMKTISYLAITFIFIYVYFLNYIYYFIFIVPIYYKNVFFINFYFIFLCLIFNIFYFYVFAKLYTFGIYFVK